MHGLLCDIILNPTWGHIQDGGLNIFNALLQYWYQMIGLVFNNSKKKATSLLVQYGEFLKLKTQFESKMTSNRAKILYTHSSLEFG
jgi:hypothetical protein